ncbi:hypothetical protein [Thermoflavimicrobium dichotomicum]|uniref:Uncharacterized protein n=1 Tax=Thermoflavimicrobium dichotomicum TaxID=46223 RepID=A0A1I3RLI6_9BACL|nr:hypothetical protein [Thermoflavimicrobium dichotomicum]SFJ46036.1 hypothetical protein SAMN05421852_11042 [Thermoflavimicrobium dichotomicum]
MSSDKDKMDQILQLLKSLQADVNHLKKNAVTREEIQAAKEAATTIEDKAEAGYILNRSLIDGLSKQMKEEFKKAREDFQNVYEHIELLDDHVSDGFKQIGSVLRDVQDVLTLLAERQDEQEEMIQFLDERMRQQEKTSFQIRMKLKKLEGE